jgi:hypothetical protein
LWIKNSTVQRSMMKSTRKIEKGQEIKLAVFSQSENGSNQPIAGKR